MTLGLAAALGGRLSKPGLHEAAALEPGEGGVDGSDRDVAPRVLGQLAPDVMP